MFLNLEFDDLNTLSTPDMGLFFWDSEVVRKLSCLHENFVIVTADEASNNYIHLSAKDIMSVSHITEYPFLLL